MIHRDHIYYDLRELLVSLKVLLAVLLLGAFLVLYVSLDFVYPFALLIAALFAVRGLIGRRCPRCDGPLREDRAAPDQNDIFTMRITWRCPRDGYEEEEKTKGDGGLFGVN
jgi:hypothetical protein